MKKILLYFSTSLLLVTSLFSDEMPEPYASINVMPFDGHGWFGNAEYIDLVLKGRRVETVIEVGSWLGCSTRYIAAAIADNGVVYAIDTWRGSPQEELHQKDPRLATLYQQFLSNVIHAGLTNKIIPFRMDSGEAARALNVKADFIYLDGAHDTQSVLRDITVWYPHLKESGVMAGDDWLWETVRVAVVAKAKELNKHVHYHANFWWYE